LADMLAKPERRASAGEIRKIADLQREAKAAVKDRLDKMARDGLEKRSPSPDHLRAARDAAVELLKSKNFSQEEISTVMRRFDERARADLQAQASREFQSRDDDLER